MSVNNKAILQKANAAISTGDTEGFLAFCADDIKWTTVGADTLHGKEAVRQWMATAYVEPPRFTVSNLIADGDFVTALGDITVEDDAGEYVLHAYCDVWRFHGGKMIELKAFVIEIGDS
ncbi:MAG: nuclear transport factor 2 family protein [Pseudomonadota bacterium]